MLVLIGKDCMDEFKRIDMEDFLFMIRDFELKKRDVNPLKCEKPVLFRGVSSATLRKIVKRLKGRKMQEVLKESPFDGKV